MSAFVEQPYTPLPGAVVKDARERIARVQKNPAIFYALISPTACMRLILERFHATVDLSAWSATQGGQGLVDQTWRDMCLHKYLKQLDYGLEVIMAHPEHRADTALAKYQREEIKAYMDTLAERINYNFALANSAWQVRAENEQQSPK